MTQQLNLDIHGELIIDNFAGGGGASAGIELALGRRVDIAINHDPEAVAMHTANHPETKHYCESVWEIDPREVTQGRPVGLVWLSPDCKHFSKAKGGKPVEKKIRGLAWVALRWAAVAKPRVIMLENVEEFRTWGPLVIDAEGNAKPCPKNKGREFNAFCNALRRQGYQVEHRELRACDYGTPTIRKRLFLIARRDGRPIVWPAPTHCDPKTAKAKKLLPWRTAAECIDWSIPCPSIFERAKPLADATLRRIAKGIMRYVVNAADPFIVGLAHGEHKERAGARAHSMDEPFRTIHAGGGNHALVAPTLIQTGYGERPGQSPRVPGLDKPLGTLMGGGQKHALVSALLAQFNTNPGGTVNEGHSLGDPISTVSAKGPHQGLVTAQLVGCGGRAGQSRPRDAGEPVQTITAKGDTCIAASTLVKMRGDNVGQAVDAPLATISAGGMHHAEVRAFLVKYYGSDQDPRLEEPLHTITARDRFGLVTVAGEEYTIADIGLRMLAPRELFKAQGFPASYIIGDDPAQGLSLTKTAQVRMVGNGVCPPLAAAIVRANLADMAIRRAA